MIKTVSVIGLGALGVMYGQIFVQTLGRDHVRFIVSRERKERYERDGIFCNGRKCDFQLICPDEEMTPADLAVFCVKYYDLPQAIEDMRMQIGPETILVSVLNGVTSEEMIAKTYGEEGLLYCTVQGMDSLKEGNHVDYVHTGTVTFGQKDNGRSEKTGAVEELFKKAGIVYTVSDDIMVSMWAKWMLNVGVNQSAAVYGVSYGVIQDGGIARKKMQAAMREAQVLAAAEGITLSDAMFDHWVEVIDGLRYDGEPSMRQDTKAGRKTEVDLFAGTACAIGRKHGIPTPVNDMFYEKLTGHVFDER